MDYSKYRKNFIEWVKSQLTGPASNQEILNGINPIDRYQTGMLFPIVEGGKGIDPASEVESQEDEPFLLHDDSADAHSTETAREAAQKKYRYMPPSSVGFSFFARGEDLEFQIQCFAVRYEREERHDERGRFIVNQWKRVQLCPEEGHGINIKAGDLIKDEKSKTPLRLRESVLQEHAQLDALLRPYAGGWIVTISLYNSKRLSLDENVEYLFNKKNELSLFEVGLSCFLDRGEAGEYPKVDQNLLSEEEQELELQYRHHLIYAIGHGAAVDWSSRNGRVNEIRIEFIPAVEVPQVTADAGGRDNKVLSIARLSNCRSQVKQCTRELDHFVDEYKNWVLDRQRETNSLSGLEKETALRIVGHMDKALDRMKRGTALLRKDKHAAHAFALANQAMLLQMYQSDKSLGKKREKNHYRWRPFQLAFILTVLESSINESCLERDIVDLIWFPTGGGKTEAYLGLVAFVIAWRRLTNPTSGGGTSVLMRYTLRLLTSQQYLRATRMICALELIRREKKELGDEPISIGMWVGMATSPNTYKTALELVSKSSLADGSPPAKLVLDSCPWCRKPFKAPDNYHAARLKFRFLCTNPSCDFGGYASGEIPCNVVDEELYANPPTFLIATIDKFARLAWEERTNAFFGMTHNRPPELIIQDELHLISGALGSIAGIYEAALNTVLIKRGIYPKYIASTATIRMAKEQVRRLYGKNLAVFPPPGLNCDDSYFSKSVSLETRPGRLYMGYFAPMLNRQKCMAPLASILLAAPEIVFHKGQIDRDNLLEAWWTLVIYHGSLKGVGNSHNSFNIDVRDYFNRLKEEAAENKRSVSREPGNIAQLTSVSSAEENAKTFLRLEFTRDKEDCLDAVLATNMISVGLDVPRLAMMIINGQPLTTAEYIQAGSRVGRSDVPGIVFINYYRDQARSLSHYENFRPYHESFYRFVEPTSITPYTFQARRRALHAALVIAVRHGCPHMLKNEHAELFDPDEPSTRQIIELLKQCCRLADEERAEAVHRHIEKLARDWRDTVKHCQSVNRNLNYTAPGRINNKDRLLHSHDDKIKGLWATLQSMRNVENNALLKLL